MSEPRPYEAAVRDDAATAEAEGRNPKAEPPVELSSKTKTTTKKAEADGASTPEDKEA